MGKYVINVKYVAPLHKRDTAQDRYRADPYSVISPGNGQNYIVEATEGLTLSAVTNEAAKNLEAAGVIHEGDLFVVNEKAHATHGSLCVFAYNDTMCICRVHEQEGVLWPICKNTEHMAYMGTIISMIRYFHDI